MLSIPDMAILGAAALMFFGPEQLPKVARKVGLLVRDVQNTSQSFIREMERAADDAAYGGPDISRAHLIEEAAGTVPPVPVEPHVYEPPAYESPAYEGYTAEASSAVEMFADHHAAADDATAEHAQAVPESTPVLHDIVAPRASGAPGSLDLPP